ncbi:MAG TPA: sensor histidine kinase [Trebonia sp.]|nr:sensor histidine kinase [Trebonia sp.]
MTNSRPTSPSRALTGWVRRVWTQPGGDRLPSYRDAFIALVITVIAVLAAYGEAHPSTPGSYFTGRYHLPRTPDAALLLVAAAGAVLAWRHRYPRLVLCASTAAVVAYSLPGYENGVALLLPAAAVGTLAADRSMTALRSTMWAAAVTAVLMAATAADNPLGRTNGGFFLIPAVVAVALLAGIAITNRRAYLASERARLARQSAQEAQRSIDEERLRIARELHDVVAHTMATITVQASAAATLLADRPEQAAESLQAIRTASKNGLRELRSILNLLRTAAGDTDGFVDPVQPAAGLARLDALAAGVRAVGLPVTLTVTGQPRELPAVTDLSAFRIIQEALTNTIRHAGPATAAVTVHYAADHLTVEVTDTGCGLSSSVAETAFAAFLATGAGAGHGLRGMRERAAAAGGTIEIGPIPNGGFRVAARFPHDADTDVNTGTDAPPETATPASVPTRDAAAASGQQGGRW